MEKAIEIKNLNKSFGEVKAVDFDGYTVYLEILSELKYNTILKQEYISVVENEFSEYMGIPLRTLEEWESGRRKMPDYVLRLIAYHVRIEVLLKEKGIALEAGEDE